MRLKPFLICLVLGWCLYGCKAPNEEKLANPITSVELYKQIHLDTLQLIDVRTPKEYNAEHIKGAQNFNYFSKDFAKEIESLNKQKPIYIYCRSGKRSGKSEAIFNKAGFTKIYNLEGGILAWKSKNLKTEVFDK